MNSHLITITKKGLDYKGKYRAPLFVTLAQNPRKPCLHMISGLDLTSYYPCK